MSEVNSTTPPGLQGDQTEALVQAAQQLFNLNRTAAADLVNKYGPLLANAAVAAATGNPVAVEAVADYAVQFKLDLADLGVSDLAHVEGLISGYLTTAVSFLRLAV